VQWAPGIPHALSGRNDARLGRGSRCENDLSCPDLIRASIKIANHLSKKKDRRVKPGGDGKNPVKTKTNMERRAWPVPRDRPPPARDKMPLARVAALR
jgi:hypothetical protein